MHVSGFFVLNIMKTEAFPDGSAITLSANTEATYDAKNWVKERKV